MSESAVNAVQAAIATTVEYHPRMLQNFHSTPENDREAGFISVGLLMGVMLLGVSMFLCNILVEKFCPGSGAFRNSSDDGNHDDGTFHSLPYSSEIRQLYLETSLKSQEFCSSSHSATNVAVATPSSDIEKGDVLVLEIVEEEADSSIRANCKKGSTNDVEMGDRCEDNGIDCHVTNIDGSSNDDVDVDVDDDALPQCLICFEIFVNGDAVTTHCTNKSYHRHCIMEWLMKHDNCPHCRRLFFPNGLTESDSPMTTTVSSVAVTSSNSNNTSTAMAR